MTTQSTISTPKDPDLAARRLREAVASMEKALHRTRKALARPEEHGPNPGE